MFKKLLSNLPFNPSLVKQVSFYSKRMKRETSVRRLSVVFIVLTMFIQFISVISPAQPSLASSSNDIISGGIRSRQDAVNWCNSNSEIRNLYSHFGVSCSAIANSQKVRRNTKDYGDQMFSLGRLAYGKRGETEVKVGTKSYYARYVSSWGTYNFDALEGTRSNGQKFLIMFDCGNIIVIGKPSPPRIDYCWLIPGIQTSRAQCDVCPRVPGEQLWASECDVCPTTPGEQSSRTQCDVCPEIGGFQASGTTCDACPDKAGKQLSWAECDVCPDRQGVQTKQSECDVCPSILGIQSNTSECRSCEQSKDETDTSVCMELHKNAANDTQNVSSADGTLAKAGDVITYTLQAKNTGKATVGSFQIEEDIGDLLDYADVTDLHGGTLNATTNTVKWPAGSVAAGASMEQKLTVKIKDPIPQTPVSASNPGTFDLTMTNVYGNAINIKLPPSVIKTTEQITSTLPNTGPGTSLVIGFIVSAGLVYFFARSRLLVTELDIVRTEYTAAGGI